MEVKNVFHRRKRLYYANDKSCLLYTSDQLIAALKEAGFTEIKTYSNTKNHWISIVATK